jgi:DNA polymerase III delta subunit
MLYLFLGQEGFLKKQSLDRLKAKVCPGVSVALNYEEFSAGEDDLNRITDCARTAPFMARYRMLVVKDADRFSREEKDALVSFLDSLPSNVVMVLAADSLLPADPFYKIAARRGKVMTFEPLNGDSLYRWITERFADLKKRIQPAAVRLLQENIGNDLAGLDTAIELLATFVGKAEVVTQADVEGLVGKDLTAGAYQIVDAIGSKDADSALRILQGLGKDPKAVFGLLGLMGWQLRRIWRAKKMADQRMPLARIAQSAGVPQRLKDSFLRQMNNFSAQELESAIKALLKLDKDIKSKALQPWRALELLIIRLCAD